MTRVVCVVGGVETGRRSTFPKSAPFRACNSFESACSFLSQAHLSLKAHNLSGYPSYCPINVCAWSPLSPVVIKSIMEITNLAGIFQATLDQHQHEQAEKQLEQVRRTGFVSLVTLLNLYVASFVCVGAQDYQLPANCSSDCYGEQHRVTHTTGCGHLL